MADNKALVAHELTHVQQMARVGGAHWFWLKYLCSRKFRLDSEAEAYATSCVNNPGDPNSYVVNYGQLLKHNYYLGITLEEACRAIRGYIPK